MLYNPNPSNEVPSNINKFYNISTIYNILIKCTKYSKYLNSINTKSSWDNYIVLVVRGFLDSTHAPSPKIYLQDCFGKMGVSQTGSVGTIKFLI